jgi:hypothetical protein
MMYRKHINLGIAIFSLIAASLACNFQASTAKTDNVRMASDENGEQVTTTFGQKDNFFLLGDLKNAPSDTKLKAVWTGVEVMDSPPNTLIDEKELVTGDGSFTFSLINKNPLWPAGKYKVDLYLNDKLDQTIEFQVEQTEQVEAQPTAEVQDTPQVQNTPQVQDTPQSQTSPQTNAAIENAYLARDQEGIDATTVYSPKENFFLIAHLTGAPEAGAPIKVVWTAVKAEGASSENQVISTYEETLQNGGFWVSLISDTGEWLVGQYKAELFLDGTPVDTRNFIVSATRLENIYMASDQEGKNPTTVYGPQDKFYLDFDLVDAPDDTKIGTKWYRVDDQGSASEPLYEDEYTFGSGSYYVGLKSDSGTWQTGKYKVDLYLNNNYYKTVTFEVQ